MASRWPVGPSEFDRLPGMTVSSPRSPRVLMEATASFVIVASALSATLTTQIPELAQWEITFAQVEAAAGLSDMRTARSETFEARLMQRPWSAVTPLPFLRLVRVDGTPRAQLFVFWTPKYLAPGR